MRKEKVLILTVWLFLFCFAGNPSVWAQIYSVPKELKLKNNEENPGKEIMRHGLLSETFYPIGWSKDGKFAYYSEPPDEACGCYFGSLYIQDLRTDKIVWKNEYEGREGAEENIRTHWRKNQKLFSSKLAEYKIIPIAKFSLAASPIKAGSDSVSVDLASDVKLGEDFYSSTGSVVLKLVSAQKGTKTVYEQKYDGTGSDGVMEANLGGILRSPFETRVVVIVVRVIRGWEGPPHITSLEIIGAGLTEGFR